ncbi:MAG: cytochrome b5 [Deltaproteobacteria bacterium]|nr:cytochrome b5 [Deltaproteobacteria bacterium]
MKPITREELEKGDGEQDRPALVSVDGRIYDVSSSGMWTGGKHMNVHGAGRDLSAEIKAAPHGPDVLERFEQVGEMKQEGDGAADAYPKPGKLVSMILARHPHPVSVHFPIALSLAGALFAVLGVVLSNETLEAAGFYNLVFGAVMSPPAIGAGLLSWWYNYGGAWTPIFRKKIVLSVLYLIVAGSAIAIRLALPEAGDAIPWNWVYVALAAVLPPVAVSLGFLGGKITFPS